MQSSAFKYLMMYDTVQEVFNKAMLISEGKKFVIKLLLLSTSNQALFYFLKKENTNELFVISQLLQNQKKISFQEILKPQGLFKHPDREYE